jgi:hypothetical protein
LRLRWTSAEAPEKVWAAGPDVTDVSDKAMPDAGGVKYGDEP